MGDFKVHHSKLFKYEAHPINCMVYNDFNSSLALSRSSGVIEIWRVDNDWYQEKVIYSSSGHSIEALAWKNEVLYTAGMDGNLVELDMLSLRPKRTTSSNAGAIWCLKANKEKTLLAAGTEEGCVVLFEYNGFAFDYCRQLNKQDGRILSLAWHESGSVIATGGLDNIRMWSVKSGHALQRITLARQHAAQPVIVWAVALLSDHTVVSGDSRGKTSFWNGDQGTLIKEFQSHQADVQAVCVAEDEGIVLSSGIDPTLVQFELAALDGSRPKLDDPSNSDGDERDRMQERPLGGEIARWVRTSARLQHSHDVRDLALCGKQVASGGVDCNLIVNKLERSSEKQASQHRKIGPVPEHSLVSVAKLAKVILFQYLNHLELWRLGDSLAVPEKNGDLLPLSSNSLLLLKLLSRGNAHIVCSAVSDDSSLLAYSDRKRLRIFSIGIENLSSMEPSVTLTRLRCVGAESLPSRSLQFSPLGTSHLPQDLSLFSGAVDGSIQWFKATTSEVTVVHSFKVDRDPVSVYHLLTASANGQYVAGANWAGFVDVFSLEEKQLDQSLPRRAAQASALCFHPSQPLVALGYTDQHVVEYSMQSREYSPWYKQNHNKFHHVWLRRHCTITRIQYRPADHDRLLVQDCQMLCVIDKTERFPSEKERFNRNGGKKSADNAKLNHSPHAFHVCTKYKYLAHFEELEGGWAVAVEKTPTSLQESLPASLRMKKFGT